DRDLDGASRNVRDRVAAVLLDQRTLGDAVTAQDHDAAHAEWLVAIGNLAAQFAATWPAPHRGHQDQTTNQPANNQSPLRHNRTQKRGALMNSSLPKPWQASEA